MEHPTNQEANRVKRRLADAVIIPLTGLLLLLLLVLPFAFALIDLSHIEVYWAPILAIVTAVGILAYATVGRSMHKIRVSPGEMLVGLAGTLTVIVVSVAVLRAGGPSAPPIRGPGGTVTIEAERDISFDSTSWSVPEGNVTVVYEDSGDVTHTLTIEGMEDDFLLEVDHDGDTDQGTVALPPGTYTLYCTIRGHREQGMEGTLTVEAAPEQPPSGGTSAGQH